MKYMGSKARLAKYILPIMLEGRKREQTWVEPFVGGGNIIDKVDGLRIGADVDLHTIEALRAIRDRVHDLPKDNTEFTEEDYKRLRLSSDYEFKGYAGYVFSFGGKWLGGWSRSKDRDFVAESYRGALKQSPKLQGVILISCDYRDLPSVVPPSSIIYCDPPYRSKTQYSTKFDHDSFWEWCRTMAEAGHKVFVSEQEAPDDFRCVWQKKFTYTLGYKYHTGVERLFRVIT